jgi:hypothetical protein
VAMAISFVSEEVENRAKGIIAFCKEHEIELDFYNLDDVDGYEDEEIQIGDHTEIIIGLPRTEEYQDALTILELDRLIKHAIEGNIVDEYKLVSPNLVLISVSCDNPYIDLNDFVIQQNWNGSNIKILFAKELNSFAIKLTMDKLYDKYTPPILGEDLFIEIQSSETLDDNTIDEIVQSFIFECSSSLNINLHLHPRITTLTNWEDVPDEEGHKLPELGLRTLIRGKGIAEVLRIYNSCNQIYDAEYQILNYTKVIEYVSQTVLRKEMLESITKRLYSPKVLNPDANYILDLEKLFSEHRNNQKDSYAIKLTVETCCDIIELVPIAPKYLKQIQKLRASKVKAFRDAGLEELAGAISDTRNMLAHAKTNYNHKGNECPEDQLFEFASCLRVVANQTIRWFSRQHEDSRII